MEGLCRMRLGVWQLVVGFAVLLAITGDGVAPAEGLHFEYGPLTAELYKAGVDVASYVMQDWNSLPVLGMCNFSTRVSHSYPINAFGVVGTLYTYFDSLTVDCTNELQAETRPCATLAAAFSPCRNLAMDSHATLSHTWTTCEDMNFRVGYLWVSQTNCTSTDTYTQMVETALHSYARSTSVSPQTFEVPANISTSTATRDQLVELALVSDFTKPGTNPSKKLQQFQIEMGSHGGLTGCNWKYSNLFPVAFDGISNVLLSGQYLMSASDEYSFTMQSDCNLVLLKRGVNGEYAWNGLWAAMSNISDGFVHKCWLELQANGNLVVHDDYGNAQWSSRANTSNMYQVGLTVQADGNVVVSDMMNGTIVWQTNTAQNQAPGIPLPPSLPAVPSLPGLPSVPQAPMIPLPPALPMPTNPFCQPLILPPPAPPLNLNSAN